MSAPGSSKACSGACTVRPNTSHNYGSRHCSTASAPPCLSPPQTAHRNTIAGGGSPSPIIFRSGWMIIDTLALFPRPDGGEKARSGRDCGATARGRREMQRRSQGAGAGCASVPMHGNSVRGARSNPIIMPKRLGCRRCFLSCGIPARRMVTNSVATTLGQA